MHFIMNAAVLKINKIYAKAPATSCDRLSEPTKPILSGTLGNKRLTCITLPLKLMVTLPTFMSTAE